MRPLEKRLADLESKTQGLGFVAQLSPKQQLTLERYTVLKAKGRPIPARLRKAVRELPGPRLQPKVVKVLRQYMPAVDPLVPRVALPDSSPCHPAVLRIIKGYLSPKQYEDAMRQHNDWQSRRLVKR